MTEHEELIYAVRQMRIVQRRHFRLRHPDDLRHAKEWEQKVDGLVDGHHEEPDLFQNPGQPNPISPR